MGLFLDSDVVFFLDVWSLVLDELFLSVGIWLYVQLWMCCLLASYS